MESVLQAVSHGWPYFIGLCVFVNIVGWIWLKREETRRKLELADHLRKLIPASGPVRSDESALDTVDDRIDTFIADITDLLQNHRGDKEVSAMVNRLTIKDESRPDMKTHRFETWYSLFRTFAEVFPLLGIVGTVIAIWAGLSASGADADKVGKVVTNFGDSVISTALGLAAAIVFMFVNAWFEPGFERWLAYKEQVRDIINIAKHGLIGVATRGGDTA